MSLNANASFRENRDMLRDKYPLMLFGQAAGLSLGSF